MFSKIINWLQNQWCIIFHEKKIILWRKIVPYIMEMVSSCQKDSNFIYRTLGTKDGHKLIDQTKVIREYEIPKGKWFTRDYKVVYY